jgi:hypothetical protein
MALLSSPPTYFSNLTQSSKSNLTLTPFHFSGPKKPQFLVSIRATDNGSGVVTAVEEDKKVLEPKLESVEASNGSPVVAGTSAEKILPKFTDPRWVSGTWDLIMFQKDGTTDWDAVIDAEVRRRKFLQDNPESSNNDDPVVFDTSIVPWWAWMKRFHLPEAELLNGRAAMIGFFMAYFVDSLTGVGLVDQMGNFFCKTLLFVSVVGVLVIRKNEDIDNLKKLFNETTFYDKQWQATWQEDNTGTSNKN